MPPGLTRKWPSSVGLILLVGALIAACAPVRIERGDTSATGPTPTTRRIEGPIVIVGGSEPAACDEWLPVKYTSWRHTDEYFTGKASLDLTFNDDPDAWEYELVIIDSHGRERDRGSCEWLTSFGDFLPHMCSNDQAFEWPAGDFEIKFYDADSGCFAGTISFSDSCKSGEEYYQQIDQCCTVGCYCTLGSGQSGCFEACAQQCAD